MKTKIIGASENITEGNIKEKLPLIKHHKNSRVKILFYFIEQCC